MSLWCGSGYESGFADPCLSLMDPGPDPGSGSGSWIRIMLFTSLTFKMPTKNKCFVKSFSAYYFLKVHLHYFPKIKSQKELQNSNNQGFSYYFCVMIRIRSRIRIQTSDKWIRIREAQKHVDPLDPDSDPQHWWKPNFNTSTLFWGQSVTESILDNAIRIFSSLSR